MCAAQCGLNPSRPLSVPCVPGGRSEAVRAHVEGELRSNPDSARGWSGADRAGPQEGGPAPHALRPLLLEGLQETPRTSLWTADIVSPPVPLRLACIWNVWAKSFIQTEKKNPQGHFQVLNTVSWATYIRHQMDFNVLYFHTVSSNTRKLCDLCGHFLNPLYNFLLCFQGRGGVAVHQEPPGEAHAATEGRGSLRPNPQQRGRRLDHQTPPPQKPPGPRHRHRQRLLSLRPRGWGGASHAPNRRCCTSFRGIMTYGGNNTSWKHFFFGRRRFLGAVWVQNRLLGRDRPRGDGAFHPVHQHHVCDDAPHHGDAELDAPSVPQTLERLLPVLGLHVWLRYVSSNCLWNEKTRRNDAHVHSNTEATACQWSSVAAAKGHIDQRMAAEAEKIARGEEVEGRYLTYFLSRTGLPMKTVYSNVTELLLAGVDTVGPTSPPTSCWSRRLAHLSPAPFRSPALCPGRCTSCPVTRRCRPRCGRRCWACWGVEGYRQQPTWPRCLCWRPRSKKYSGGNRQVFPSPLGETFALPFSNRANHCFSGCTPLFLPTPEWSQRETFKSEATSSQKTWVRRGKTCTGTLCWSDCGCWLFALWLRADSDHPLPLCDIAGSGCVSTSGWIPAPALAEQGAEPPSICLRTLWGGEAQLHRSTYRWAGALPRCCQGEFGMQGNWFGPIRLLTLLDRRKGRNVKTVNLYC